MIIIMVRGLQTPILIPYLHRLRQVRLRAITVQERETEKIRKVEGRDSKLMRG